jgi:hypothetical protein
MRTMMETLALRLARVNAHRSVADPVKAIAHVIIAGPSAEHEDEQINAAEIGEIGSDFLEVNRRMISRDEIREVQPINF